MNSVSKTTFASVVLIVVAVKSFSQINFSGYEVGISAGTLVYQGELTPRFYGYTKSLRPAVGLYVGKSLGNFFAVRGNLLFGKFLADERKYSSPEYRQYRALKFSSKVTELSSTLVFNPFGENTTNSLRRLSPYVFAGAGVTFLKVKRDWSGFDTSYFGTKSIAATSLGADTMLSVPKAILVLPLGIGLKYKLSERLSLNAEATWRLTSSDYIDGFRYSDEYNNRDSYYGVSVGLGVRLGKNKYACPIVAR